MLRGAGVGILSTYLAAAICVAVFRFPIPFDEYRSGISQIPASALAVTFYGLLGGFVVQAVLGGLAGLWAHRRGLRRRISPWPACRAAGFCAAVPGVATLAILDHIVGSW